MHRFVLATPPSIHFAAQLFMASFSAEANCESILIAMPVWRWRQDQSCHCGHHQKGETNWWIFHTGNLNVHIVIRKRGLSSTPNHEHMPPDKEPYFIHDLIPHWVLSVHHKLNFFCSMLLLLHQLPALGHALHIHFLSCPLISWHL